MRLRGGTAPERSAFGALVSRLRGGVLAALVAVALVCSSCLGSTGGDVFAFDGFVEGTGAATFVNGRGYEVSLSRAKLHVGAVYLNRARPTSVASGTECTLAGIYVAEVPGGADVDLLSGERASFAVEGRGTSDHAQTGEVWLMGEDVNATADPTVILDVAGVATKDGTAYPFEGKITIGSNRVAEPTNPALPGSKPICKERVVSPIAVDLSPREGGALVLAIDPSAFFANVDFDALADGTFRDDDGDQPSRALYAGLHASAGAYTFRWE
ncbi:MAG: hypothetical protein U0414_28090 [Polyangiaceae bacterium]